MWLDIAFVIGSYLLGALPINRFIAWVRHVDLRGERDLHIALWRKVGRIEGFIGVLADMAKGVAVVLIGRFFGFSLAVICLAGIAAVVGQMWPVFSRFSGEKGNTTGLAMAATLDFVPVLLALAPAAIAVLLRSAALGMIISFAAMPLASWLLGRPVQVTWTLLALFVLITLRRLTAWITEDIQEGLPMRTVLLNRFLYDRSKK